MQLRLAAPPTATVVEGGVPETIKVKIRNFNVQYRDDDDVEVTPQATQSILFPAMCASKQSTWFTCNCSRKISKISKYLIFATTVGQYLKL